MDVATSLVQAYLHVNGYFTATDYPIVEARRDLGSRTLTDVDMLAVRFSHPAHRSSTQGARKGPARVSGPVATHPDPVLASPADRTDMIVAEVKQGRAQVNPAARNHQVLAAALARFGCCDAAEGPALVQALLQDGRARGGEGHEIRMVLFASRGDRAPRGWHWVHLDHVLLFLDDYLRSARDALGGLDLHDHALAWLALQHKCGLQLQPESAGK
jgi:hypothetical protein